MSEIFSNMWLKIVAKCADTEKLTTFVSAVQGCELYVVNWLKILSRDVYIAVWELERMTETKMGEQTKVTELVGGPAMFALDSRRGKEKRKVIEFTH
jgi:hypothetical protein